MYIHFLFYGIFLFASVNRNQSSDGSWNSILLGLVRRLMFVLLLLLLPCKKISTYANFLTINTYCNINSPSLLFPSLKPKLNYLVMTQYEL